MTRPEAARTLTTEEFRPTVERTDGLLLVELWEPRCAPCRATVPSIDSLARHAQGHGVVVATVNVREHPSVARAAGIDALPVLLVFEGGEVRSLIEGAEPIQDFASRVVEEVLGAPSGGE
jgi:thioredoxin-like negative regulator of GroEL